MQEATITDADGLVREYAYDDFDGSLYVKDADSIARGNGKPYRPIYKASDYVRGLTAAHAEMWRSPEAALKAIATVRPIEGWRRAH
ncbi:hypothetical protein [Xenophilus sp.]|uniref:hypothetical protein n=1 Tax=Xenophilus sp. TaxID=1873499 RepID=UPI0037DCEE6E